MEQFGKVARAGLLLAAVAASCRLVSLLKEVVVASVFGASLVTDAYALAMLIPGIGMALCVAAAGRAFLVLYPRFAIGEGAASGTLDRQFLSGLLVLSVLLAAMLSLLLPSCWSWLIVGEQRATIAASRQLIVLACWLIVPIALVTGLTAVLNARQRFASPQATALLPTLGVLAALAVLGRSGGALGLLSGLFAGTLFQAAVLGGMVWAAIGPLRWQFQPRSPQFVAIWRLALPVMLLDLAAQCNTYVDRTLASTLPTGSIAIVGWSAAAYDMLTGTMIGAFMWVLLPHFARQVEAGQRDELRRSCDAIVRYAAILLLPLSAIVAVCLPPVLAQTHLGRLDRQACAAIGWCLAAYGLGLFAIAASAAMHQALLAIGHLRALLVLALLASFLPNLVLDLLLIEPLGVVGLALATALVSYTTLAANYAVLRMRCGAGNDRRTLRTVLLAAAGATALGVTAWVVFQACSPLVSPGLTGVAVQAGLAALGGVSLYAFLLLVFPGDPTARDLLRRGMQTIARKNPLDRR